MIIYIVMLKDSDDLGLCIGRCGHKWTNITAFLRESLEATMTDVILWRLEVQGGGFPGTELYLFRLYKKHHRWVLRKENIFLWPFHIITVIWNYETAIGFASNWAEDCFPSDGWAHFLNPLANQKLSKHDGKYGLPSSSTSLCLFFFFLNWF